LKVLREKNNLEKECQRLRECLVEKENHARTKLPVGSLVYRKNRITDEATVVHYLCAQCYEKCIKMPLQPTTYDEYTILTCHKCQSSIQVERLSLNQTSVLVGNDRDPSEV
jgi:hypothetical protein